MLEVRSFQRQLDYRRNFLFKTVILIMDKADLTGESSIHNWVDKKLLEHSSKVSQGLTTVEVSPANHLNLTMMMLLPFLGVWAMERETFGGLRRNGIIFDWIIGGVISILLMLTGILLENDAVLWVGISLFIVIRVAVIIIGNDHIRVHNSYLRKKIAGGESGDAVESSNRV